MTVDCGERDRLSCLYQALTSEYLRTVTVLQERRGVMPKEDYIEIKLAAEQARLRSEQARIDLEQHCRQHGCSDGRLSKARAQAE